MRRYALISARAPLVLGALAPLVLLALPARADFRAPIAGAEPALPSDFVITVRPRRAPLHTGALPGSTPILPSRFMPTEGPATVPAAAAASTAPPLVAPHVPGEGFVATTAVWTLPLVDRQLSSAEREADLAPELQNAVLRIEPIYDMTRVAGLDSGTPLTVSAGTAAMDNVFADHWSLATPDPTIGRRVPYLAMAWQRPKPLPCTDFVKARPHTLGDPSLTTLDGLDCRLLLAYEALRYDAVPPLAIAVAAGALPIFAAPLPGARMSSQDFWAARKAQIEAIQARLHETWQARRQQRVSEVAARP